MDERAGGIEGDNDPPDPDPGLSKEWYPDQHGPVRRYFRRRSGAYTDLERRLKGARIRSTVDEYLAESAAKSARFALIGGVVGTLAFVLVAVYVQGRPLPTGPDRLLVVIDPVRGATAAVVSALIAGGIAWVWYRYVHPLYAVDKRRDQIDGRLPSAITFLYALNVGGTSLTSAIRTLAEETAIYGELAREFDAIVREMDLFGNDPNTAIRNVERVTPSEPFARFLNDLRGALTSGGEIRRFLKAEIDEQRERRRKAQEAFVERLALLSELFVAGFVVGPLLLLVALLVVQFVRGGMGVTLAAFIYVVLPLGALAFFLLVDLFAPDSYADSTTPRKTRPRRGLEPEPPDGDDRYRSYAHRKRYRTVRESITELSARLLRRPTLAFGVTIPLGASVIAVGIFAGRVRVSGAAMIQEPVWTTIWLFVLPGFAVAGPVAVLYEYQRRRQRRFKERLPDVLELAANANRRGVTLAQALASAAASTTGPMGEELRVLERDVRWNHDPAQAIRRWAVRIPVQGVAPTLAIVARASKNRRDIHDILEITAEDVRARVRLESTRRQEVRPYITIIFVGSLVYLLVIVVLTVIVRGQIGDVLPTEPTDFDATFAVTATNLEPFRMYLFHSALLQGTLAGLLGGKLANDTALDGLRYALPLVLIITVVFVGIEFALL